MTYEQYKQLRTICFGKTKRDSIPSFLIPKITTIWPPKTTVGVIEKAESGDAFMFEPYANGVISDGSAIATKTAKEKDLDFLWVIIDNGPMDIFSHLFVFAPKEYAVRWFGSPKNQIKP